MKLIVLTNSGSVFGKKLINSFTNSQIQINTIVAVNQDFKYYIKLFKFVKKRVGLFQAIFFH